MSRVGWALAGAAVGAAVAWYVERVLEVGRAYDARMTALFRSVPEDQRFYLVGEEARPLRDEDIPTRWQR